MAERKRASGFVLMDAAFAADAKFRKLERRAASPHDFAAAVGVFWLLLGDARRSRSAEIDWDDYDEYVEEIAQLKEVHLLQADGFDPEVFERWAPAYRSPSERTLPYPSVPFRSSDTNTSTHINSPQVSNGVGGPGEGETGATFMGFKPKSITEQAIRRTPKPGEHIGQHDGCAVCAPLRETWLAANG